MKKDKSSTDGKELAGGTQASGGKKWKRKAAVSLVVACLLGGAGFACWSYTGVGKAVMDRVAEYKSDKEKKRMEEIDALPPVNFPLEIFTVNLMPEEGEKLLQTAISLKFQGDIELEKIKAYVPEIRNKIILTLGAKSAMSLQTPDGKEALRRDLYNSVKAAVPQSYSKPLSDVLFTSFFIQ